MKFKLLIFLSFLFLFHSNSIATTLTGKVISVADGDTITILNAMNEQVKIRLAGVDCPEKQQAFGQRSKQFTSSMVAGKNVTIEPETTDRYGRTVAMVFVNGSNLNEQIVANGYGWVYRKYCNKPFCDDWLKLEDKARNSRIGLWADSTPVPPWEWRHGGQGGNTDIKSSVAGSGTYHGNVNSHVFHGPGCQHYHCKNCTVEFKSIDEALKAG